MIFKLYFILLILLFMPRNSHSQLYELSEKAAAEIIISLSEGELLSTVNLEKLNGKRFKCYMLPLKIQDADGAPCRVIGVL